MELEMYIVDAFSNQQFKGNSAAVVPVKEWPSNELMQNIAMENNLSETAFIKQESVNQYAIRWFSPLTEVAFCGHATLAASYVLFNLCESQGELEFVTNEVGSLYVNCKGDGRIEMSFPNQAPERVERAPEALLQGLSIEPSYVLKNRQAYFAVYDDEQDVYQVNYDSELLKQLAPLDVVVTAAAEKYDFVSRYFWPANGGDEDPVTGSIHTGLAPYWGERLDKKALLAFQASARGGNLYCQLVSDRVLISGFANLYLKGTIYL
ncbi:phenazine biosynthesis PhzC/PhzF protein [Vibrio ichthyoenteri ATCC 700023]|uniref:Phenazine biosynthesis PhzC/PhzF protein n=1 Tax=Vibrio ichthyoenteri ATCC 700023 TaxID=870968 RepID=F9S0F3_9VIBR|nr:PhzF family phenazine biosynthesis protein [Vibrio ichthyoenteri]EGU43423.1 phenazine biosynthesis PhzC/PhzF protein [Vibrio ichthyoenteri ATCC 700023]